MPHAPTLFYDVMVERFRGTAPNGLEETLDAENFDFDDPEAACEKARAAVQSAPTPVLLPDGIEMTQAQVEAYYYTDEDDEPLPPKSRDEYQALEDAGKAFLAWTNEWPSRHFLQDLPPEITAVLVERERVAYEEWAAFGSP